MAHKHKIWEDDDLVNAFAWLDYCASNAIDFRETATEHLNDARKHRDSDCIMLEWHQVKRKLVDQAREYARQDEKKNPSLQDMIEKGVSCIAGLPSTLESRIEKIVPSYELPHDHMKKQKRFGSSNTAEESYAPTLGTRTQSNPKQKTGNTEHEAEIMTAVETPRPDQGNRNQSRIPDVPGQASHSAVQKQTIIHNKRSQPRRTTPITTEQRQPDMNCINEIQTRQLQQKDQEIARIRAQWQLEAEKYAEQEYRLKEENEELRMQIGHHLQARQNRERAGPDYLEADLFRSTHELWIANERIGKMIKSEKFTRQDLPGASVFDARTLDYKVGQITSELDCIVPPHPVERLSFASDSDLGSLIRTASTGRAGQKEESAWLRTEMTKFEPETVVRALVIGALHDWVFLTDFPKFSPADLRLLGAYRDIVIEHGGWKRLQNLDLAAHGKLINREQFKNTIEGKAVQLACRFSKALEPLFTETLSHTEFPSWDEDHDTSEDRRSCLIRIFKEALEIKARSVTTDKRYEFVLHPLGTSDKKKSSANPMASVSDPIRVEDSPGDSWQYASLHTYEAVASNPRKYLAEALVDPRNFVSTAAEGQKARSTYIGHITAAKREGPTRFSNTAKRPRAKDKSGNKEAARDATNQARATQMQLRQSNSKGTDYRKNYTASDSARSSGTTAEPSSPDKPKRNAMGLKDIADDVDSNPPKRLRRNSTRRARPINFRDDSDSDTEIIDSSSTDAPDDEHDEDERVPRENSPKKRKRPEKPRSGSLDSHRDLATQQYSCPSCLDEFPSASERDKHWRVHSICIQEGQNHIVSASNVRQDQSHTPCDRCGMLLRNSDLHSRDGKAPTKCAFQATAGNIRGKDENPQASGGNAPSEHVTPGEGQNQGSDGASSPRSENQPAARGVKTARNADRPLLAPPGMWHDP